MPITDADIKILAAERNTDNQDGGGRLHTVLVCNIKLLTNIM